MKENVPNHMELTFWGTRGSISTPGRSTEKYGGNTPCVSVRHGDTHIVFDAGTGIRNLGMELAEEYAQKPQELTVHLFLSHTHWDHIQGLPFFAPAYMRGVKLLIYGSSAKRGFLGNILRGQMSMEYFPVGMTELAATVEIREIQEAVLAIDELKVAWEEQVYHPGGCIRFAVNLGERRLVYASDVELDPVFRTDGSVNEEGRINSQKYLDFVAKADVLVGDGQYTAEEYQETVGWGHTTAATICRVADLAQVRRLAVFHHDPRHTDKMLDNMRNLLTQEVLPPGSETQIFWAREGMTVPV